MAFSTPEPLSGSHDLDQFDCGEPALNDWLKKHALSSHKAGSARVFVTLDEEDRRVVGYYALSAAQVEADDATERLLKGQPRARPVPAVLLGRLAVDAEFQDRGLGQSLLRDAMGRCLEAAEAVGIRALIVHAKDQAARDWYAKHGFEESPSDPLHLILLMKDLRQAVERAAGG